MIDLLQNWLVKNKILFIRHNNLFTIFKEVAQYSKYLLLEEKSGLILDKDFNLILSKEERAIECDGYIFNFGGKFYYSEETEDIALNELKYIGKANQEMDVPFTHLGVHGPYEMLSGSTKYEKWVQKAKFLGHKSIGICEQNSLAGIFLFQKACEEGGIKPIIGETISVRFENKDYNLKLYVKDEIGYKNLLQINKEINIINTEKYINLEKLTNYTKGLFCILSNEFMDIFPVISNKWALKSSDKLEIIFPDWQFEKVYFQIDTVIWDNKNTYLKYLSNIKKYFDSYYPQIEPVLINDAYYLDEDDFEIKQILSKISGEGHVSTSRDQYFKSLDDSFKILENYFGATDARLFDIFEKSINSTLFIESTCNFKIKKGVFHLPKFNSSHLLDFQSNQYQNNIHCNENIFIDLIERGALEKFEGNITQVYKDRINTEIDVIKKGGFIDYFLILWDIIRFCKENGILTGLGRGSAAGSLVAYLLDITRIDPIKHDLLFERFMNEGRLNSPPDIDTDIATGRRGEVIEYVKGLYGTDYFCNVGTYTTLKIKSGIRDLAKIKGLNYEDYNHLTTFMLDFGESEGADIEQLFKKGLENPKVKDFIQNNVDLVHLLFKILEQPKAISVHPCATIIVPKEEGTIYENFPLRRDGEVIISEFQGPELESMGYLKEDLLALLQLDKFERILELIKENNPKDKPIDIYSIKLNDPDVMHLFQQGFNGDVFQFGSEGLTQYSKDVKPENIDELINMVALYRPGPIGSGAHYSYVKLKNREKEAVYDFGLEEVTKETFGLIIFQEQVMKACQVLGGFSLTETDEVRRAMGKKKEHVLLPFKDQFVKGAISQGCDEVEAKAIWDKLIIFSAYGFNKSHAAVYSITGYISQWFKFYYPVEFWTTALEYSDKDAKAFKYIQEINNAGFISIVPPDINKSEIGFRNDATNKRIYWSISKIKFLGEVGTKALIEERAKNGKYFSIEEFYTRVKDTALDKRMVSNLIFSGCFDEIYKLENPIQRLDLLKEYFKIAGIPEGKELWLQDKGIKNMWWWALKQRELTGLGYFDFYGMFAKSENQLFKTHLASFCDFDRLQSRANDDVIGFGGIVKEAQVRKTIKNKEEFMIITLDCNGQDVLVYMWAPEYKEYKEKLYKVEKKIMLLTGVVQTDKKNGGGKVIYFYDTKQPNALELHYFEDLTQYKEIKKEYVVGDIREMKDGPYQLNNLGQWKKIKK